MATRAVLGRASRSSSKRPSLRFFSPSCFPFALHSLWFADLTFLSSNTPPLKLDGNNSEGAIQDARQKWNSLSSKTKIAVGASVAGTCLAAACVFAFCCIKQRRLGRKEKEIEDAKFEKSTAELMAYRAEAAARQMQWQQQRQQQAPRQGGIPQTYVKGHTQRGSWGVLNAARGYQRF